MKSQRSMAHPHPLLSSSCPIPGVPGAGRDGSDAGEVGMDSHNQHGRLRLLAICGSSPFMTYFPVSLSHTCTCYHHKSDGEYACRKAFSHESGKGRFCRLASQKVRQYRRCHSNMGGFSMSPVYSVVIVAAKYAPRFRRHVELSPSAAEGEVVLHPSPPPAQQS